MATSHCNSLFSFAAHSEAGKLCSVAARVVNRLILNFSMAVNSATVNLYQPLHIYAIFFSKRLMSEAITGV